MNTENADVLHHVRVPDRKITSLGNAVNLNRFDPSRFSEANAVDARSAHDWQE